MKTLGCYDFGDTRITYLEDASTGAVGWIWIPVDLAEAVVAARTTLRGEAFIDVMPGEDPWPARVLEPLVQFKRVGDPYPGAFAQGHTLRGSPGLLRFRLESHEMDSSDTGARIETVLVSPENLRAIHLLEWVKDADTFTVKSSIVNGSGEPVVLEMLSSFTLGGVTPFQSDDAAGRLTVHRFRSGWSAEGRLESRTLEDLHLERSWSGAGLFSERFGQVGTMPVRRWFPFVAIEDTAAGVLWGGRLSWAGSWQMEVSRQHDDVCLSGGLADREFGHWMKKLQPGERLDSPSATLACVKGSLDDLCDRLTAAQTVNLQSLPKEEEDLPIVLNEWCTTWGEPAHERMVALADSIADLGVRYLVIDAGWYKRDGGSWDTGHGDWNPNGRLFPQGIEATAAAIRERGMVPGLWYEMETVGSTSNAFNRTDLLLCRDGQPVTVRGRRFWDLNNPAAVEFLTEKVIDLLERGGFGYLKVDYNETLGLGCDHPDSLGEGLRQQVLASYRFFDRIRERLPALVIENCASGGHRLEPSMIGRTAMSSFSDAHELPEIPLIAANLHALMLPRQSQIWAVLHPQDSERRLVYSLAATFLGRMCLSGSVDELSAAQRQRVGEATAFYKRVAPVIRDGVSRRYGQWNDSWRHLEGWQAVLRRSNDGHRILIVVHAFENPPTELSIPWDGLEDWTLSGSFGAIGPDAPLHRDGDWVLPSLEAQSAQVFLYERR